MVSESTDGWVQLHNSQIYDFRNPSLDDVSLLTIAHSLSLQCRFNGHCRKFYSVAEHSLRVWQRVVDLGAPADVRRGALMHDAAEAIICDFPRPLKKLATCFGIVEEIKKVERLVELRWPGNYSDPRILQADLELLATEKEQVMDKPPRDWGELPALLEITIACWEPWKAKDIFCRACRQERLDD